jgi:hypothetical protein
MPWPNPNPNGIAVLIRGRSRQIDLRIYSRAMRLLAQSSTQNVGTGWHVLALDPQFLSEASNGTYYYFLTNPEFERNPSAIGKFVINK